MSNELLNKQIDQGEKWSLACLEAGEWEIADVYISNSPGKTMELAQEKLGAAYGRSCSWQQIKNLGYILVRFNQTAKITGVLNE